jgi:hypothetical protein
MICGCSLPSNWASDRPICQLQARNSSVSLAADNHIFHRHKADLSPILADFSARTITAPLTQVNYTAIKTSAYQPKKALIFVILFGELYFYS